MEEEKKTRVRRQVTKETIDTNFTVIIDLITNEINTLKEQQIKGGHIRFFASIRKKLRQLKNDYVRVQRCRPKRVYKSKSGFMKPVILDAKLLKFPEQRSYWLC